MTGSKANRRRALAASLTLILLGLAGNAAPDSSGETTTVPPQFDQRSATEQAAAALAKSLVESAREYGPDAVALQAALLVRTIEAGAAGSSSVRILGDAECPEQHCLAIEVETGIYFDADTTTPATRLDHLWEEIVEPVLTSAGGFAFEPAALDLVLRYRTQRFSALIGPGPDPDAPAASLMRHVTLPAAALSDLKEGRLDGAGLRRAAITGEELPVPQEGDQERPR